MSDSDAFKPMDVPDSIKPDYIFSAPTRTTTPSIGGNIDPRTGQPRRGKGRPPGSRNKPKETELGRNPPQGFKIPPGKRPPPVEDSDSEEVKKSKIKAEKDARAAQYSAWITEELNEKILMFFLGATGAPPEAVYKAGSIPLAARVNPNLTDLGNRIVIPPDLSDSLGKLMAELAGTNGGKAAGKLADNNMIGVAGAAFVAVFSGYRYYKGLQPILEQIKQAQANQSASTESNENDAGSTA